MTISGNDQLYFRHGAEAGRWAGLFTPIAWHAVLEREGERLFLWTPVCFGIGIGVYFSLANEPAPTTAAAAVLGALGLRLILRNQSAALAAATAILCVALGFAGAKLRTEFARAPELIHKLGPVTLNGWVVQAERNKPSGFRVTIRVISIERLPADKTPKRVRVTLAGRNVRLMAGEAISLRAVLRPPPQPVMPGGYNFARRDWFRQIGAVGYAVSKPEKISDPGAIPLSLRLIAVLDAVRQAVSNRIRTASPRQDGSVADALITGQRRTIDERVMETLRRSGLAHVLAISGLHMALIAGTLFWAVRALLALCPHIALKYPVKKLAAIAAIIGGGGYLALSGAAISTQRAYIMIAIMFLAVCSDRPAISQRNVALAALAVLIPRPESLLDVGFQMSFAAVVALVAVYEAYAPRLAGDAHYSRGLRPLRKASEYFLRIAVTTVVASLAVAPFAAYHFHQFAHYGLFANLAAMPVVGIVIMPAALLSLIAMPFGLEAWPLWLMALGINFLLSIAGTVSEWPGAVTAIAAMPAASLTLMALGALWICLWQSVVRYLGLMSTALGLLLVPSLERPDILIDREAKIVAVRTPGGELVALPGSRSSFSLEKWLKADGDPRASEEARRGNAFRCDLFGCIAKVKGKTVAIVRHPHALAEDCARSDIVISQMQSAWISPQKECSGPALFIGARELRREGAHAIYISKDGLRTQTVMQLLGNRPWVRKHKEQFARLSTPVGENANPRSKLRDGQ